MSLHVAVSGWLLGEPSGANRRIASLLRAAAPLLSRDERISVLHRPTLGPLFSHAKVDWVPVPIRAEPTWKRVLDERRVLPDVLRELQVDVLDHALLPAPIVPCKLALTIHDCRDADGHGERPRWLGKYVLRKSLPRAAALAVPSAFTGERVRAHAGDVPMPPMYLVPNGVDPAPETGFAAASGDYLLHVGHVETRKNLDVLLHALAVLDPMQRPKLVVAGAEAGAGKHLGKLANRLGVSASLRFTGSVRDQDVSALYAGARAVVVPSHYEGFGLPVLEGLAAGAPVLVSDRGALPEVAGDAATVLPADDPVAWADAIRTVARAESLARAARAHAARWSWTAAAKGMLSFWREARGADLAAVSAHEVSAHRDSAHSDSTHQDDDAPRRRRREREHDGVGQ